MTPPAKPTSPCVNYCVVDREAGLCRGCARSVDEIATWGGATEEFRAAVWAALPARLAAMGVRDDMGAEVPWSGPPARVVSLVPSLTEALAASCPQVLVGCTDWCTHPAGLDIARVRGTKNPDIEAIAALEPDLVVANKEENRAIDVQRLRDRNIPVWVTDIVDVPGALTSMGRLLAAVAPGQQPDWLTEARTLWSKPAPATRRRVAVPIWRDPWMVVGGDSYTNDLLQRLGLDNVYAGRPRYPRVPIDELDRADIDVVLLPDEPYRFTAEDGPEAFTQPPTQLVSGRLLTWYGPAMVEAWHRFAGQGAAAH